MVVSWLWALHVGLKPLLELMEVPPWEKRKNVLKVDPTGWLLERENPVVRYWALRDLVGVSEGEIEAARLRGKTRLLHRMLELRRKMPGSAPNYRDA